MTRRHSLSWVTSHSSRSVRRISYPPEKNRDISLPSNPFAPVISILPVRAVLFWIAICVPSPCPVLLPDRPDPVQGERAREGGLAGPCGVGYVKSPLVRLSFFHSPPTKAVVNVPFPGSKRASPQSFQFNAGRTRNRAKTSEERESFLGRLAARAILARGGRTEGDRGTN